MKRNNYFFIILIIIGISLILLSIFILFDEIHSAKKFCNSINQTYSFFNNFKHECNGRPIYKYSSDLFGNYWGFSSIENSTFNLTK